MIVRPRTPAECIAAGEWRQELESHRAELRAAKLEGQRQAEAAAMAGIAQGLSYLSTRRINLSAPEFGSVTPAQVTAVAARVPQLEAMFLPPSTILSEATLTALRCGCPEALCLAPGCEVSEQGYQELRAQHGRHDAELAEGLATAGLQEGLPPDLMEPEPEQDVSSLSADADASSTCRALDLTGSLFARAVRNLCALP